MTCCVARLVSWFCTAKSLAKLKTGPSIDSTAKMLSNDSVVRGIYDCIPDIKYSSAPSISDGLTMPLHVNDRQFIDFQSSGDFFRHRHIVDEIKAHWPSPEEEPLCVEVDYLSVPPRVLVQPVWDFFWAPGYHTAETERYLRTAKQEYEQFSKRVILVCVIIRNGDLSNKYLMLLDIDHEWQ